MQGFRGLSRSVALGAALLFAGAANAQDFGPSSGAAHAGQLNEGGAVALHWSMPLGGGKRDARSAPNLSFRLSHSDADGASRGVDMVRYTFGAEQRQRITSPFALNANEGGGGSSISPGQWLVIGVALGVAVYVLSEDNDSDTQQEPT